MPLVCQTEKKIGMNAKMLTKRFNVITIYNRGAPSCPQYRKKKVHYTATNFFRGTG